MDRIGGADRFDYDANGNMTVRNKGLVGQQTLVWDAQNRLSQVQDNNGDLLERYWYDVDGARVKKVSGTTTTYTFSAHYEEEVTDGVTTAISHYSFGGLRVAVKRGGDLFHLHGDHLGSTSLTTDGAGAGTASRAYYAYGAERSSSGDLQTDRTFTGQKSDASGLMYYNARYYDPALGIFISPDSLVPDALRTLDYNRFLYAGANPLRYTDPTGHCPWCIGAVVGAVLGAGVSYGAQVVSNVSQNGLNVDAFTDVSLEQVGAGAIAGAVGGATFGLGTAFLGTGVVATVGSGAASGALAGQTAIAAENVLNERPLTANMGDPLQIARDAAIGGGLAGAGYGIGRAWAAINNRMVTMYRGTGIPDDIASIQRGSLTSHA